MHTLTHKNRACRNTTGLARLVKLNDKRYLAVWQFYKQNIQHVVPFAIENKHYFTVNQTMQSFWREVEDIRDRE